MKFVLLCIFFGLTQALPNASNRCNLLRSSPFLSSETQGDLMAELELLIEFSRFMNHKTPSLLQEFVALKSSNAGRNKLRSPRSVSFNQAAVMSDNDTTTTAKPDTTTLAADSTTVLEDKPFPDVTNSTAFLAQEISGVLGNSTQDVIDLFQAIVEGAGSVLPDTLPSNVWNYLCVATWYPIHEEYCEKTRCAACTPAIMTAAAACEKGNDQINHRCIQRVMGEGSCNYCISEFMGEE